MTRAEARTHTDRLIVLVLVLTLALVLLLVLEMKLLRVLVCVLTRTHLLTTFHHAGVPHATKKLGFVPL